MEYFSLNCAKMKTLIFLGFPWFSNSINIDSASCNDMLGFSNSMNSDMLNSDLLNSDFIQGLCSDFY